MLIRDGLAPPPRSADWLDGSTAFEKDIAPLSIVRVCVLTASFSWRHCQHGRGKHNALGSNLSRLSTSGYRIMEEYTRSNMLLAWKRKNWQHGRTKCEKLAATRCVLRAEHRWRHCPAGAGACTRPALSTSLVLHCLLRNTAWWGSSLVLYCLLRNTAWCRSSLTFVLHIPGPSATRQDATHEILHDL